MFYLLESGNPTGRRSYVLTPIEHAGVKLNPDPLRTELALGVLEQALYYRKVGPHSG